MGGAVMNTERWSALLSLVFVIVAACYFQWWDVTYDGGLLTRWWVKFVLWPGVLIMLLVAGILLVVSD
jgi:hypothetical protein